MSDYTGIYETASRKNPFQVQIAAPNQGLKRRVLGNCATLDEAIELRNNAAFWLSQGGWGIHIPLQGSEEQKTRYTRRHWQKPEDMPPRLEELEPLFEWCELNLTKLQVPVAKAAATPGAILLGLRDLSDRFQTLERQFTEALSHAREKINSMQANLDPHIVAEIRVRDTDFEFMRANPNSPVTVALRKEWEEKFQKFPCLRVDIP